LTYFSGGGRSNGLDCSERSNLLSKKYVSLVLFATVWIFKPCKRERIKALLTIHELRKSILTERHTMENIIRKGRNMKKYRQQDGCYKLVVLQLIKKFTGFYEI